MATNNVDPYLVSEIADGARTYSYAYSITKWVLSISVKNNSSTPCVIVVVIVSNCLLVGRDGLT